MRSVQGRLGTDIVLADTNLPEITEKRLLKPINEAARRTIDDAFASVRGNREVWDILLLGAQYGDAGIGSDAAAFRRLYPFSPALVATLVALSQALQRERTALKVMTELLCERRDTLRVNDLIGVAALFEPLVLRGELPDRPQLKQKFQDARDTYLRKFRRLLLNSHGITEEQAAGHEGFELDDRLIKTLILGYLVSEVPALHNLTAAKLHALNFGSIASPIPGYENQIVLGRLRQLTADAGELHMSDGPDPVISIKITSADYDKLLELGTHNETAAGVLQQLVRDMVCGELGLDSQSGTFGEYPYQREWRGRKHLIHVRFGNVRDRDNMPDSALIGDGDAWRIVIDYPFDPGHRRNEDFARIETLERGPRTVFWMPLFLTDDVIPGSASSQRSTTCSVAPPETGSPCSPPTSPRATGSRPRPTSSNGSNSYGPRCSRPSNRRTAPPYRIRPPSRTTASGTRTLAEGARIGDPRGGTLADAFRNLTAELLEWSYPGTPALPEDEKAITRAELGKVLNSPACRRRSDQGVAVDTADQRSIRRICNPLRLGELIDHRYVLTATTCWWSGHLLTGAARENYTEHFPVHVLRRLLDEPEPRGFDRDLQNLIIAIFAEEHQLAWRQHGAPVRVDSVHAVIDQMELHKPVMPSEDVWLRASKRAGGIFGAPLPGWLSPSNVAAMAQTVRSEATRWAPAVVGLIAELKQHADTLGLDKTAGTGRLATANQVATLLADLADEADDVVLVNSSAASSSTSTTPPPGRSLGRPRP